MYKIKLTDIAMGTYYIDAIKTEEFLQWLFTWMIGS